MSGYEINFDGLVGNTHHYAGLSFGNEASIKNQNNLSNPKLAAKQGLAKMKALADMGMKQGVIAPHARPYIPTLKQIGFTGSDSDIIAQAMQASPTLLSALSSASCMWVANACIVSPSADSSDGRVHFTAANLNNKFHRSVEHQTTSRILQAMFKGEHFAHHVALPDVAMFGDEGAANHNRFGKDYASASVQAFVYGQDYIDTKASKPKLYPARQTLQASQAIARLHGLNDANTIYIQQNPDVIDQGVFHNDVISVSNQNVFFAHELAFVNQKAVFNELRDKMAKLGAKLQVIEVPNARVSVNDAVNTYLFNSQLITRPDGKMSLILPSEAREHQGVWSYLQDMLAEQNSIDDLKVFDLRESMRNGGGPACLRLRVAVNDAELQAVNPNVMMNDNLFDRLNVWVDKYYRDRLSQADLADPELIRENHASLDELTQILNLGSVYYFQQN
ncbi:MULTISPECIES: N-succinylarginine dihydrolase [unclassified Acinetobacter]|uniref:N-succinylarginine dihydrolase n=1 Tax=unclassified Acinetobacter TaxID=196816 RepID=UPI0035B9DBB7